MFLALLATVVSTADATYSVAAPKGWSIDLQAGRRDGLPAVFTRAGETYAGATTVLYSRTSPGEGKSLAAYVARDMIDFKVENPGRKIARLPPLGKATVVDYAPSAGAPHERVAFLAAPKAFVVFAISSRDEKDFSRTVAAFEGLVRSYRYVGKGAAKKPSV